MRPILFNTEMVKAILNGRKTVTRRIIKPQPVMYDFGKGGKDMAFVEDIQDGYLAIGAEVMKRSNGAYFKKRPYERGDILYVRETWSTRDSNECHAQPSQSGKCPYESCGLADGPCFPKEYIYKASDGLPVLEKWHPSIHMPKEAARIFLRVTEVKMEQLNDISKDDAGKEGVMRISEFIKLWNSTLPGKGENQYSWKNNPWVWVIRFERIEKKEAFGQQEE